MTWLTSLLSTRVRRWRGVTLLLAAGSVAACGSSKPPTVPQAGPQPTTTEDPIAAVEIEPAPTGELDETQARAVIEELERHWPKEHENPLANPQSLEDVEAILKLDQVNLFGKAVEFAAKDQTIDGMALHAQIELAWGETYMLLMEILMRLRDGFVDSAGELVRKETGAPLPSEDKAELAWLHGSANALKLRIDALKLVSIDHIAAGFSKAEEMIEKHPDSYLGYRLAADYHRILREWDKFDEMVAKIREINPSSNGLLFLLGAHAYQTKEDRAEAEKYYRQALANDPQFVRAQAHLLIIQSEIERTYAELLVLEKLNPHHQFVALAGEAIKKAYGQWKVKQAKMGARPGLGVGRPDTSGGLGGGADLGLGKK